MSKKKKILIISVGALVLMCAIIVILWKNRTTIYIYYSGDNCVMQYQGDGSSCFSCCTDNLLYATNKKNKNSAVYYKIKGNTDKILGNYITGDYIMLDNGTEKYLYNYVYDYVIELPDDIQALSDEVLATSIIITYENWGSSRVGGLFIDLDGTKHYSYYSLVFDEFLYTDESIEDVISYDVNLFDFLDNRYILINVTDYQQDTQYTLIYDTESRLYLNLVLDYRYGGSYSELFNDLMND